MSLNALARPAHRALAAPARWVRAKSSTSAPSAPRYSIPKPALLPPGQSLLDIDEAVYAKTIVHGRGVFPAYHHPQTHGIPVALIHLRSFFPALLTQFAHFATHAAASLAVPVSRAAFLPTQRSLWTVPRSPFVHKGSQENFERRVHRRAIKAWDADAEVVERWIRFLQLHQIGGVGIRVVRWERAPVGVGELAISGARAKLAMAAGEAKTSRDQVKTLGEKIVRQELASQPPQEGVVARP